MTALRTAAQQALEALEDAKALLNNKDRTTTMWFADEITALRAALAQQAEPAQEPAFHGFMSDDGTQVDVCFSPSAPRRDGTYATAYYTAPPHRVAQQAEPVEEPVAICCNCLGTKRPHADDPEWKGRCDCEPPQLAEPAQEPVAWVASKDGRVIYDDASTDDGLLRVSGDFENDEQRISYAKQIVDKLNAAPPQRTMVPLTEDEILAAVGWERAAMYMKLTPNFPVDEAKKETLTNARAVEKASWEKNHG